jgi:defect-in-organelle-trafficking protein DotD
MARSRWKYVVWVSGMLSLAGCAAPKVQTDVETTGMPNAELALQRAITQVNADMAQIGTMGPERPYTATRTRMVIPDELRKPVDFIWTGSLDEGVRKLADSIGYQTIINRPQNAQPIPIAVNIVGTVISAFHTLGDQAGSAATVAVDPRHHQVQVIHHA